MSLHRKDGKILSVTRKSSPETFEDAAINVYLDQLEVLFQKQQDYGPTNILGLGVKGVFVRAWDKIARLKRLVWEDVEQAVEDEKIQDTWGDLANYGLIALMLEHDQFDLPLGYNWAANDQENDRRLNKSVESDQ